MKVKTIFNYLKADGFCFTPQGDEVHMEVVHDGAKITSSYPTEWLTTPHMMVQVLFETPFVKQAMSPKTLQVLLAELDVSA